MYFNLKRVALISAMVLLFAMSFVACPAPPPPAPPPPPPPPPPAAKGTVEGPPKLELKADWPPPKAAKPWPIVFKGSGWKPEEAVVISIILPPEIRPTVKGEVDPDGAAGIAFGYVDKEGKFTASVTPGNLAYIFMRGDPFGIKDPAKALMPDPATFKPLPAGTYKIRALGSISGVAWTSLEIVAPK